jgi:hypothetical protein
MRNASSTHAGRYLQPTNLSPLMMFSTLKKVDRISRFSLL